MPLPYVKWDARREPRRLTREEVDARYPHFPEGTEYVDGPFASDRERVAVLRALCETMGLDRVVTLIGRTEDWRAAVERRAADEAARAAARAGRP